MAKTPGKGASNKPPKLAQRSKNKPKTASSKARPSSLKVSSKSSKSSKKSTSTVVSSTISNPPPPPPPPRSSKPARRSTRRKRPATPEMTEEEAETLYKAAYRNLRLQLPFTNPTSIQVRRARLHNEQDCMFLDKIRVDLMIMILKHVLISSEPIIITREYAWPSILASFHFARQAGNEIYYKSNTFAFVVNTQDDVESNALWLHELTANNNKRMMLLQKVQFRWQLSHFICSLLPTSPFAAQFGRDWCVTVALPDKPHKRQRFSERNPPVAATFDNGIRRATDHPRVQKTIRHHAEVVQTTLAYQNANWFIYFSKANLLELMKDVKERGMLMLLA